MANRGIWPWCAVGKVPGQDVVADGDDADGDEGQIGQNGAEQQRFAAQRRQLFFGSKVLGETAVQRPSQN